MSKLLRRYIKKFTTPRTRRSSTPSTSLNSYWDAFRGWIPRKLGTHSGAPNITSATVLLTLDEAVDFLQYSFTIVDISLGHHQLYFPFIQCFYIYFEFGITSCTIWRPLWSFPKIFYLYSLQYFTIGLLQSFLVYQLYVILPFTSLPMITSSFERFPWDTSLSHSVWESKIPPTPQFSIACFICWNGSHFCFWGCSWR